MSSFVLLKKKRRKPKKTSCEPCRVSASKSSHSSRSFPRLVGGGCGAGRPSAASGPCCQEEKGGGPTVTERINLTCLTDCMIPWFHELKSPAESHHPYIRKKNWNYTLCWGRHFCVKDAPLVFFCCFFPDCRYCTLNTFFILSFFLQEKNRVTR